MLSSLQIMGVPAEVTPRAPGGEQKAPGLTVGAADGAVVGVGEAGWGAAGGAAVVGPVVAGGPPLGMSWLGHVDSTLAMAACSAGVTHK